MTALKVVIFSKLGCRGRVIDMGSRDPLLELGLEPHWRHFVLSLSKTFYSLFSTGSSQC